MTNKEPRYWVDIYNPDGLHFETHESDSVSEARTVAQDHPEHLINVRNKTTNRIVKSFIHTPEHLRANS